MELCGLKIDDWKLQINVDLISDHHSIDTISLFECMAMPVSASQNSALNQLSASVCVFFLSFRWFDDR